MLLETSWSQDWELNKNTKDIAFEFKERGIKIEIFLKVKPELAIE